MGGGARCASAVVCAVDLHDDGPMRELPAGAADPAWPASPASPALLGRLLPLRIANGMAQRPGLQACMRVLVLLAAFIAIDRLILRLGALPQAAHFEPVLALEMLRGIGWPLGLMASLGLGLVARFGALGAGWAAFGGRPVRGFVVFLAALLTWFVVTRSHNFHFDQSYWVDKGLAGLLLALLWRRPAWILPLSLLLALLILQQAAPALGASILAHKLQLLHVLHLFAATVLLHALTGRTRAADFVFLCCCMVAGSYFTAALAKIDLQWWRYDQIHLLPVAAYAHGWLDFLGADGVGALARALQPVEPVMRWAVLAVETGCLFFLLHRRIAATLLVAVLVFHCGVLALYGFFFWTWMLLDIALLVLLLRGGAALQLPAGDRALRGLSLLLIATALLWSRPPWLGWLDTGLTYTYRFEAVDASGHRYALRPDYFAPYEDVFTMAPFSYSSRGHPALTSSYGVTKDADIARALGRARSADEVFAIEQHLGRSSYIEANAERLRDFVSRHAATRNRYIRRPADLAVLGPPAQFISHRAGAPDKEAEPISEIVVVEVTLWFDGRQPAEIRRLEVARIPVPR